MDHVEVTYAFDFADGQRREFRFEIDAMSGALVNAPTRAPSDWTRLEFEQCRGCKLKAEASPHCPVAAALDSVVDAFLGHISHQTVNVTVGIAGRTISKSAPLQEALQSLFGVLMVTSGCPAFERLRPMARFHLPFSSPEETTYRVVSMYMLAQYLRSRRGLPLDLEFRDLNRMYEEIHDVNVDFVKRLRRAGETDAHLNSVVSLDCLTTIVPLFIRKDLPSLGSLFSAYLSDDPE